MTASKAINKIAKEKLDIETLEVQNLDSKDFHDLSVWEIKAALEAAYEACLEAAK